MSSNDLKRSSSEDNPKKVKLEPEESISNELLQKYSKISTLELENLCERLMYYDSTGIYVPPPDFNCKCVKKRSKRAPLVPKEPQESGEVDPRFGRGAIGIASKFNDSWKCDCCQNGVRDPRTHILNHQTPQTSHKEPKIPKIEPKTSNFEVSDVTKGKNSGFSASSACYSGKNGVCDPKRHLPGPYDSFVALLESEISQIPQIRNFEVNDVIDVNKMADGPSTSGFHQKIDFRPIPDPRNHEDLLEDDYPESALDLSFNSDQSGSTILYSDVADIGDISENMNLEDSTVENRPLEDSTVENLHLEVPTPLNLSHISIQSVPEVPNNPIFNPPAPRASNDAIEVVDLTHTPIRPPRPLNPSEVIEIDDSFQSNLTPGVVETIDLLDDSDDDVTEAKGQSPNVNSPSGSGLECPICFESLRNKKIMSTTCGHIFCSKCISNAFKTKKCCPSCRKRLKTGAFHPLYINL